MPSSLWHPTTRRTTLQVSLLASILSMLLIFNSLNTVVDMNNIMFYDTENRFAVSNNDPAAMISNSNVSQRYDVWGTRQRRDGGEAAAAAVIGDGETERTRDLNNNNNDHTDSNPPPSSALVPKSSSFDYWDRLEAKAYHLHVQYRQATIHEPTAAAATTATAKTTTESHQQEEGEKALHYVAQEFQLSITKSLSPSFTLRKIDESKDNAKDNDNSTLIVQAFRDQQLDDHPNDNTTTATMSLSWSSSFEGSIICHIPKILAIQHFPHFAMLIFPCWSLLQRFPKASLRAIQPAANVDWKLIRTKLWNRQLIQAMEASGIAMLEPGQGVTTGLALPPVIQNNHTGNLTTQPSTDGTTAKMNVDEGNTEMGGSDSTTSIATADTTTKSTTSYLATMNQLPPKGVGFQETVDPDKGIFRLDNTIFFMEESDAKALQKAVLQEHYYWQSIDDDANHQDEARSLSSSPPSAALSTSSISTTASTTITTSIRPLQVLVLDRMGESRQWPYSQQFANYTTKVWNHHNNDNNNNNSSNKEIQVKVISSFQGYSLQEQALEMHRADIIISSHGAQLTNLAFIRPCTVVFELFTIGYVIGYFPSLALVAGGIPYIGYPHDQSHLHDNMGMMDSAATRKQRRDLTIRASPESIARALSTLIRDHLTCRRARRVNHKN